MSCIALPCFATGTLSTYASPVTGISQRSNQAVMRYPPLQLTGTMGAVGNSHATFLPSKKEVGKSCWSCRHEDPWSPRPWRKMTAASTFCADMLRLCKQTLTRTNCCKYLQINCAGRCRDVGEPPRLRLEVVSHRPCHRRRRVGRSPPTRRRRRRRQRRRRQRPPPTPCTSNSSSSSSSNGSNSSINCECSSGSSSTVRARWEPQLEPLLAPSKRLPGKRRGSGTTRSNSVCNRLRTFRSSSNIGSRWRRTRTTSLTRRTTAVDSLCIHQLTNIRRRRGLLLRSRGSRDDLHLLLFLTSSRHRGNRRSNSCSSSTTSTSSSSTTSSTSSTSTSNSGSSNSGSSNSGSSSPRRRFHHLYRTTSSASLRWRDKARSASSSSL